MRIAFLSDIHGNTSALDAVLADARAMGVEQYCVLGDICALGPEPSAVIERLASLPNSAFTRGNTDRYVVTGDGPPPDLATVQANPGLVATYAEIAASSAWTRGYITAGGWFDWLEKLPLELRLTATDGMRILGVHSAPGEDDGEGVHAARSNAELSALLAGADADLVLVGHTHEPMIRNVDQKVVVNLGCVSNPRAPDLRASYVVLEFTANGVELEHRRVAYDHETFVDTVRRSRHPSTDFILKHQYCKVRGRTPHADHSPSTPGEKVRLHADNV